MRAAAVAGGRVRDLVMGLGGVEKKTSVELSGYELTVGLQIACRVSIVKHVTFASHCFAVSNSWAPTQTPGRGQTCVVPGQYNFVSVFVVTDDGSFCVVLHDWLGSGVIVE
jgi:hypothetical protein